MHHIRLLITKAFIIHPVNIQKKALSGKQIRRHSETEKHYLSSRHSAQPDRWRSVASTEHQAGCICFCNAVQFLDCANCRGVAKACQVTYMLFGIPNTLPQAYMSIARPLVATVGFAERPASIINTPGAMHTIWPVASAFWTRKIRILFGHSWQP